MDYGFELQRWMLLNFKIIAIMESSTERWFPDARVKTCITILERCSDESARRNNPVRFVRFDKPLAEIIGKPASAGVGEVAEEQEQIRQAAVDRVRDAIERTTRNLHEDRWRIIVKRQGDLWEEGVNAGAVLKDGPLEQSEEESEEGEAFANGGYLAVEKGEYVAGKWGRYLRAPDFYFDIIERFKDQFVPLGKIVAIGRGITSGCDAFFMPTDVTKLVLAQYKDDKEFRTAVGALRREVVSGALRIIKDGAGTFHAIEPEFIRPEVHSLMKVDRPVVRARDLDRVVVLVKLRPYPRLKGHMHLDISSMAKNRPMQAVRVKRSLYLNVQPALLANLGSTSQSSSIRDLLFGQWPSSTDISFLETLKD